MKIRIFIVTLFAALVASGCNHRLRFDVSLVPTLSAGDSGAHMSLARLAHNLTGAGFAVQASGPVEQNFFSVLGQRLDVGGADIQVYEYPDVFIARQEAARVAPDASSIHLSDRALSVNWIDAPHFYHLDYLIVLYVGRDPQLLDTLDNLLGQPYAVGVADLEMAALAG